MVTPLGMLLSARERLIAEREAMMADIDKQNNQIALQREAIVSCDAEISALNVAIVKLEGVQFNARPTQEAQRVKVKK